MYEIIVALATWRITSLIVREDGPYDIFAKFRKWIGVYYDELNIPQGKNVIAKGITCVWCASVWFSFAVSFFAFDYGANIRLFTDFMFHWFGLSAAVIVIDEVLEYLGRPRNE